SRRSRPRGRRGCRSGSASARTARRGANPSGWTRRARPSRTSSASSPRRISRQFWSCTRTWTTWTTHWRPSPAAGTASSASIRTSATGPRRAGSSTRPSPPTPSWRTRGAGSTGACRSSAGAAGSARRTSARWPPSSPSPGDERRSAKPSLAKDRPGGVEPAGPEVFLADEEVEPPERRPGRLELLVGADLEEEPPVACAGRSLLAVGVVLVVVLGVDSGGGELALDLGLAAELVVIAEQPVQREPLGALVLELDALRLGDARAQLVPALCLLVREGESLRLERPRRRNHQLARRPDGQRPERRRMARVAHRRRSVDHEHASAAPV